ncbi:hypothetical protein FB451DRAFT_1556920 [Mycena latifolia]|nr:hypothetical protein FB451DRAFT_1556920 [Mycena latifolia]
MLAGPIIRGAPEGFFTLEGLLALVSFFGPFHHLQHIPHPEVIETLGITSPGARVGFPVSFLPSRAFPHSRAATCRSSLRRRPRTSPRSTLPAPASSAAASSSRPTTTCPPCIAVAVLAHALRAFAALATLALVKACAAPALAVASAAALLRRLPRLTAAQSMGTYTRVSDVRASERGRGSLAGRPWTDKDEDAPLQLVLPRDADSASHLVWPYGFWVRARA